MLRVKPGVEVDSLRKYGFKPATEWPNYELFVSDWRKEFYFLFSLDEEDGSIYTSEDNLPMWEFDVHPEDGFIYIDGVPNCTYHIDNMDMEKCYSVLYQMIKDDIIEDVEVD